MDIMKILAAAALLFSAGARAEEEGDLIIDEIVEDMNVDLSRYAKGVYNLNGQLVSEKNSTEGLPAGVYIMNGKKMIMK